MDLWNVLIKKINQRNLLGFGGQSSEQQTSILQQLAFLTYSTYELRNTQIDALLLKMIEGFKNANQDVGTKKQLFLLCRILILRLKDKSISATLEKLWPHLLA
jgi:hypothetical protein